MSLSIPRLIAAVKKVLVDPYRLANFQNYWYLIVYDPSTEILKTYYLKNISDLQM